MSTSTEIARLQTARNKIRTKFVELGIATSTSKLDDLADATDQITNRGAVSATVQEGNTYTIPKGYHNGSGTVSGVSGGGNYTLQSKPAITPTKSQINVTPDSGYYGMSDVTIEAIPEAYQDVSSVTADKTQVLTGAVFVKADGTVETGTMTNNGKVTKTLTTATTSYTVPKGYHDGTGTVSISTETKTATPTKSQQTITPTSGKVLSSVTVGAIPSQYVDTTITSGADASQILSGKEAFVNGEKVSGTMANNGAISETIDGITKTSCAIPAGYTSGGTVSLTSDIEEALAAI